MQQVIRDHPDLHIVLDTPTKIAVVELHTRLSPINIIRKKNEREVEIWPIRNMIIP
jgi:hypothetical protein